MAEWWVFPCRAARQLTTFRFATPWIEPAAECWCFAQTPVTGQFRRTAATEQTSGMTWGIFPREAKPGTGRKVAAPGVELGSIVRWTPRVPGSAPSLQESLHSLSRACTRRNHRQAGTGRRLLLCLMETGSRNVIMLRSRAPTCSIWWSCSRWRVASNHSRPDSFSAIQFRA